MSKPNKIYVFDNFKKNNYSSLNCPQVKKILNQILPSNSKLEFNKNNKPYFTNKFHPCPYISVSHSKNILCLAVFKNLEIGIDIEFIKNRKFSREIARKYFSKFEQSPEYFYHAWTAREAFAKSLGGSIFELLPKININYSQNNIFMGSNNNFSHEINFFVPTKNFIGAICFPLSSTSNTHYSRQTYKIQRVLNTCT